MKPLKILAPAMLLALVFSSTTALAATPGSGTSGFSSEPAVNGHIDNSRSRFTYQLSPGQTVSDEVFVSNTGSGTIQLVVYAADATTTLDGAYDVPTNDQQPKDVGSWVSFQNGAKQVLVTLKHDKGVAIPFKVTVPNEATPGDHAGGIAVGTISSGDGQIKIQRRIVTRLYARIQGALNPSLTISSFSANYNPSWNPFDGTVVEQFTIANNGNVALKATAIGQVFGAFGNDLAAKTKGVITEILPGTSRMFAISIPHVGQWVYLNPAVTLVPATDKDALDAGKLPHVHRDSPLWIIPFSWLVVGVIAFAIFTFVRRRISTRNREIAKWLEFTEIDAKRKASEG
jgi:hypothetical protein